MSELITLSGALDGLSLLIPPPAKPGRAPAMILVDVPDDIGKPAQIARLLEHAYDYYPAGDLAGWPIYLVHAQPELRNAPVSIVRAQWRGPRVVALGIGQPSIIEEQWVLAQVNTAKESKHESDATKGNDHDA